MIKPTPTEGLAALAEWMREKQVTAAFGIGRTTLLRLRSQRKIKSSSFREAGMKQGTLLYNVASIRAYIERMEEKNLKAKEVTK